MTDIHALLFDQDGVIIDTERDGHRVAFNRAFREFGFPFQWDEKEYHGLLQVGGGKERMRHYLHTRGFGVRVQPEEEDDLIQKLHRRKTEIFLELLRSGSLPLRPGIRRFMREGRQLGLPLGICTTSSEKTAEAIAHGILGEVQFQVILAGDVVRRKKPDPEIYTLASQRLGLDPSSILVIEDSRNGLLAAKGAGMRVLITTNSYTEQEDLHEADLVVTCLGDPEGEKGRLIRGGRGLEFEGVLEVRQLLRYFREQS